MKVGCSQKSEHWCLCKLGAYNLETNHVHRVYRIFVMVTCILKYFVGKAMDIGAFYLNLSLQFSP